MTTINMAPDLKLPLDAILLKKAILAKTGAGKSNTSVVFIEETFKAGVPVVVIDPKGDQWGIRSSADGKKEGLSIVVMGGMHADIPLQPESGTVVARTIVESGASFVVDVSEFTKKQLLEFTAAFCTEFYRVKLRNKSPCLLVIEEADEVAPQDRTNAWGPAMPMCLAAVEKIIKRGRFLGIGTMLVTQRSASLNKNLLSQSDMLILMRTSAPQDIKAVDDWIKNHQDQEQRQEVLSHVQSLKDGEAFVWCPEFDLFTRTRFRMRTTFDAGQTPKIGQTRQEPKKLAAVDLKALGTKMEEMVEKTQQDDPEHLRQRIKQLEADLRKKPKDAPAPQPKVKEVPILSKEDRELIGRLVAASEAQEEILERRADEIRENIAKWSSIAQEAAALANGRNGHVKKTPITIKRGNEPLRTVDTNIQAQPVKDGLSGPQQRIIDAIAWFESVGLPEPTKTSVAFMAGYKPGGGAFNNPLGQLRQQLGLIEYGHGTVHLTAAGRKAANKPDTPPSLEALHQAVMARLDGPMQRILTPLLSIYPAALSKGELAELAGYAEGGGAFNNPLGRLRSLGLIDYPEKGMVVAEDVLFPEVLV